MTPSGYQIEILIKGLRRLRGLWPLGNGGPDSVQLTEQARALAQPGLKLRELRAVAPSRLRDARRYEAVVERELERRAGRFMLPPYDPPGEPPRFPKIRRPEKS